MANGVKQGVVPAQELGAAERAAIRELAEACNAYEGLDLPLEWGDDGDLPGGVPTDRFSYYQQGQLIGFASLQGVEEVEVYGMVHPDHRRKGVGRALLDAAKAECRRRGLHSLILAGEEVSQSGKAFIQAMGGEFRFAEYTLELDPAAVDRTRPRVAALRIRPADAGDTDTIISVRAAAFGDGEEEVRRHVIQGLRQPNQRYFLAMLEGEPIGTLRLSAHDPHIYITGFGVRPEYQGRGYGRQMLIDAIDMLLEEGRTGIRIEVETENRNALGLYQSCGFRETTAYGYYHLDI